MILNHFLISSWKEQQRNKRKKPSYSRAMTYDPKEYQLSISNDLKDTEAKSLDNLIC